MARVGKKKKTPYIKDLSIDSLIQNHYLANFILGILTQNSEKWTFGKFFQKNILGMFERFKEVKVILSVPNDAWKFWSSP